MNFDKKHISQAVEQALSQKGERKFTQSLDVSIAFRDYDVKKTENRINLDIILPFAPKKRKVALFADGELAYAAKDTVDRVISGADIEAIAKDKKKRKELYTFRFLSDPKLMATVGKSLSQALAPRGLLPKPLPPGANLKDAVDRVRRSVSLKTKNLPVVHCIVGAETMNLEEITENVQAVVDAVLKKVPEHQVASIYVKTTMGKPIKVGA
ncbi:MAG: 50S ribosomal protein L1 [Candidatus Micrarchaeota archaeon]|nr:50S ribosomal protein L1 [Candidatus Micrarchaeota archaeon]